MTPIFTAIVKDGKLIIQDIPNFRNYVSSFEDRQVDVAIKNHSSNRTNAENRYYWGVIVKMVGDEIGIIPEEAHELLKGLFLKIGVEHEGKRYEITKSTASLSVEDFEKYCEDCRQWSANELNCPIPLPNEIELNL